MKHFLGFYLIGVIITLSLIFGGCSEQSPTAPASVEKVVHDTTYVPIDNPVNPPAGPVLPPVASFWKTDADGQEWTYFVTWFMKDSLVTKPEPWWLDPVPEWVLANKGMDGVRALGYKFDPAGVIELAPGSTWDCHRTKGHFVAFQVESDLGQYANPGLAGNWIGENKVDPNRPALIPGVHIAPETFNYWFTPVPWGSWL